ncbi:MAG: adenylate/guanylate cyclase domain-containing protein, partial [Spirochaetota bacterium]
AGYHLYSFIMIPLPFFVIDRKDYKTILLNNALCLFNILFCFYYLQDKPPLYPLPASIDKYMYNFVVFVIIFSCFAYSYYFWNQNAINQKLLEREKEKAENLLLNILPGRIANELKETGKVESVFYEKVTIVFTDFVGFTKIVETMPVKTLVQELDAYFTQFDEILSRNKMEKIKTIGDAYMFAGGLPEQNTTHAIDACLAAIEMREIMNKIRDLRETLSLPYWEIRIGINTGDVSAGVVGLNKFTYDIWGDSVNVASRMESSGEPSKINISRSTYLEVKDFFHCSYRGKVSAKNKGEVDMYFLENLKEKFWQSSDGSHIPNEKFRKIYHKLQNNEIKQFSQQAIDNETEQRK